MGMSLDTAAYGGALIAVGLLLAVVRDVLRWRVPMVCTSPKVQAACLSILRQLPLQGSVVDLGAGLGTIVRAMAHHLDVAEVCGVEASPVAYAACRTLHFLVGRRRDSCRITWRYENFLTSNLGEFSAVFCYLYPDAMQVLAPKLARGYPPVHGSSPTPLRFPGGSPSQRRASMISTERRFTFIAR